MKFLVLLDQNAPGDMQQAQRRIADGFVAAGADAEVRLLNSRWLDQHATEASQTDIDAVIAAGAEQMLNNVANALAKAGRKPMGVLPLDSSDYFARELEVPHDLDAAIAALAKGSIVEWPVGEVNGRIFLSASTIGVSSAVPDLRLTTRGRTVVRHASGVIVSSNPHALRLLGIGPMPSRERGLLNVYVAAPPRPRTFITRMLRAIYRSRTVEAARFQGMALPEMRVERSHGSRPIDVTIDGQVLHVRPPLHYRLRHTPLRVLVPSGSLSPGGRGPG